MRLLLAVAMLSVPLIAQSGPDTLSFHLRADGAEIGTATYTIDAGMSHRFISADFNYTIDGVAIKLHRDARFFPNFEEVDEKVSGTVGTQKVSYLIAPDSAHTRLNFDPTVDTQQRRFDFALNPHTVVFANFDPSGIQALLNLMHGAAPPENGKLWAFAPMGHGALLPASFTPAPDAPGKLDGKPVQAKHATLSLADNTMDIYWNADGSLLEAAITAQNIEYVRNAFTLDKPTAK